MSKIRVILGDTLNRVWRWGTSVYSYAPITAITQAAPAVITAPDHGIPDGWRVAVVSVLGMTQINAPKFPPREPSEDQRIDDYQQATVIDTNTVALNKTNSSNYSPYVSGGYLMFRTPVDLSGFTAQMKIIDPATDALLYDASADLTVDNTAKSISLSIPAATISGFTWNEGEYSLQAISSGGIVTTLDAGRFLIEPEACGGT